MAVHVTNTTQLSTFSLIRSAIVANSTLSSVFNTTNIHQYEPKHKSAAFKGFPYIWVNIPDTDSEKVVMNNNFVEKEFTVPVFIRIEYMAREKALTYGEAFIAAIEAYESTFQASGYFDVMCDIIDVNSNQQIEQKEIVEIELQLQFHGTVSR